MAIAGGLSAQLGIAEESTFGTAVTPTRFDEFVSESVKYEIDRIESKALRSGRRFVNSWLPGAKSASGVVEMEVMPNGIFALLSKHMLGQIASATATGGVTSKTHTAKVGPLDGKSLTLQLGRTGTDGTTRAFTYNGVKIPEWELSIDTDGFLLCKFTFDAIDETTATALATASYPANALTPLAWVGTTVTIAGTQYDAATFSLSGKNGLALDRKKLGSATRAEQLEGADLREYTGTIDLASLKDLTAYNLFVNGTEAQVIATFQGGIADGTANYMVRVTMPRVRFDGETPNVGGPELVPNALPYKVLDTTDAKTAVQIETTSMNATP